MKTVSIAVAALAAMLCLFAGPTSAAGDDHGHDHGAPTTSTGPASPRFAAVSETFELVGVLNGRQLTLYLDRFADNSPVKDAQLDLDIDGVKVKAAPHGEGEFQVMLAEAPKAGVLSITATVVAGEESDLLAGEIDIHEVAHADAAATARPGWQRIALWMLGALVALGLYTWIARRPRLGGAA
ncbi:MAG: hypothetical protein EOO24_16520 [Comamonadaceae bacterium]|nr:MAG: hypothetical protein EOO24_16520 [Comamonadaceae bacterium]